MVLVGSALLTPLAALLSGDIIAMASPFCIPVRRTPFTPDRSPLGAYVLAALRRPLVCMAPSAVVQACIALA